MASESTEETVTVSLPAELDDWLDERAAALDTDRETVLVQLLASYRATAELDGDIDGEAEVAIADKQTIEETVTSVLSRVLDDRVESTVQTTVQSVIDDRVDAVEDDYMGKIQDVRERVVQLKRELEGKAASDHDHDELDRIETVATELGDLDSQLETLEADIDARLDDQQDELDQLDERLEATDDRLQTIAWVVSDLREAHENGSVEAVDRIKRAAAEGNVDKANCENCGETVNIGLLTEPNCPHCQSTVTNVEPASGFFGKPRLLTASQLESGEDG